MGRTNSVDALPDLKQVLGALIFGANRPLSVGDMRKCLQQVAETDKDAAVFADVKGRQLRSALSELARDLETSKPGFTLEEVSGGFRLQSVPSCGRWLKVLLQSKPQRLSRPALETLAIVAYRQPLSRADIEAIRGVNVGHVIKSLMELHLVKIAGRSDLPGRPFLYGTAPSFLTHFGLKDISELQKMAPLTLAKRVGQAVSDADATDGEGAGDPPAVERSAPAGAGPAKPNSDGPEAMSAPAGEPEASEDDHTVDAVSADKVPEDIADDGAGFDGADTDDAADTTVAEEKTPPADDQADDQADDEDGAKE